MAQRYAQLAVAEQDQRAWFLLGTGAQDRREIAMRVAGDTRDTSISRRDESRAAAPRGRWSSPG
ncbi:MAG TPA: hypothetical protein VKI44_41005 [Acetobacteraceae bacterium]|nr:hypothetical protein [Acetobacteraceae bacterium]